LKYVLGLAGNAWAFIIGTHSHMKLEKKALFIPLLMLILFLWIVKNDKKKFIQAYSLQFQNLKISGQC